MSHARLGIRHDNLGPMQVTLMPSEEPKPAQPAGMHPIFDAPLVDLISAACLKRWHRLRAVARTYAAGNASGDPDVLNKADLKYVLLGSLKGEKGEKLSGAQVRRGWARGPSWCTVAGAIDTFQPIELYLALFGPWACLACSLTRRPVCRSIL